MTASSTAARPAATSVARRVSWVGCYGALLAVALLALAGIDDAARAGHAWAHTAFWAVMLVLFAGAAFGVCRRAAPAGERLQLLVLLGLGLYVAKVLHSPAGFTFHDELVTQRSVVDLRRTGVLFSHNPVVRAYPLYPGFELASLALARASGLSPFAAGLVVIGLARLMLTVALFRLLEHASGSERIAGIGGLLYVANPSFVFFDAQAAYESFALPLAVTALAVVALAADARSRGQRRALVGLAVVLVAAVVVSHHATSYALFVLLVAWTVVSVVRRRHGCEAELAVVLPVLGAALLFVAGWLAVVGGSTQGYLGPIVGGAVRKTVALVTGAGGGKAPFRSPGGPANSVVEQLSAYASVAIALALLIAGVWRLRRVKAPHAVATVLLALALVYPASLALRLTQAGVETSTRASEFVFLGLALVGGGALAAARGRGARAGVVLLLSIAFAGGIVVGWAPASRLPGRPLVDADPRSVEPYDEAAAVWAARHLPAGSRLVGDRASMLLMAAAGDLDPVVGRVSGLHVADLVTSTAFGAADRKIVRRDVVQFIVVDRRLSGDRPVVGYYVDRDEPRAFAYRAPLPPAAIAKFAAQPELARIYDNGEISIYSTAGMRAGAR